MTQDQLTQPEKLSPYCPNLVAACSTSYDANTCADSNVSDHGAGNNSTAAKMEATAYNTAWHVTTVPRYLAGVEFTVVQHVILVVTTINPVMFQAKFP